MTNVTIQIRIDQNLKQQFQEKANTQGKSLSSLLIEWIKAYVAGNTFITEETHCYPDLQDLEVRVAEIERNIEKLAQKEALLDTQYLKQLIRTQALHAIRQWQEDLPKKQALREKKRINRNY